MNHLSNPMFWVLIVVLVVSGFAYGGFSVGAKRVGKTSGRVGRK